MNLWGPPLIISNKGFKFFVSGMLIAFVNLIKKKFKQRLKLFDFMKGKSLIVLFLEISIVIMELVRDV